MPLRTAGRIRMIEFGTRTKNAFYAFDVERREKIMRGGLTREKPYAGPLNLRALERSKFTHIHIRIESPNTSKKKMLIGAANSTLLLLNGGG